VVPPRKSRKKHRSVDHVTSVRKIDDAAPSSPAPSSLAQSNKVASPAPSSPRSKSSKGSSLDFVDAVALPAAAGKTNHGHNERRHRYHHPTKQQLGNETPSTNDSTRSNLSLSNHGTGGVPNLLLPALSRGGKDTPSVMSSIADEYAGVGDDVGGVGSTACSDEDDSSLDAAALIRMAKTRVGWQSLHDENEQLKELIAKKDEELGLLHGQLRQAVATKCDLVIAHREMEKVHEADIFNHEENIFRMQAANKYILEQYAQTERELLNELIRLNDDVRSFVCFWLVVGLLFTMLLACC
jgi:hypothetical protein